jgi:protein TonB
MRKYILIPVLLVCFTLANAQTKPASTIDENKVYTAVEHSAEFPGGLKGFYAYLSNNIKYPEVARQANAQGKVFITFVVGKDGSLTDFKIMKGVSPEIDVEAIRVMQASPKWKPGTQDGRAIRQQYTVPISFSLTK